MSPCDPAAPAFDDLVDELIARQQAGEAVDWSVLARQHPEHAGRLRSLAGALQALGELSSASDSAGAGVAPLSAEVELLPGVLGDFQIRREVGRGGMGVVYEADQVSLQRRVALKVLPLAATLDPRQLERFRHEARAAALLHHPHIVPVYGVGCARGVHYYAMQLIAGCSLEDVLRDWRGPGAAKEPGGQTTGPETVGPAEAATRPVAARSTLPFLQAPERFRRIVEVIAQAADALEYAHTMGVVHRDIKPANLLLDAGGNVWVTDFGLARLGAGPGVTVSGDLLGTLRYMSPEQALARHGLVDHRTDVYSLGATLYELLTLRPAVDGATRQEVLHRLASAEPVPPRKLDRSIPVELETVALKALAKDPAGRYASAGELADDLRRWQADRPIRARPPGPVLRVRKWSARHRPLVVALGVFLVLLVIALCLGAAAYGVKKGELADEWKRLAALKERSEQKLAADLRQVLIERAEGIRLAHAPGYRGRVWADLRQALDLRAAGGDDQQARATVLACLGDPLGLEPVADMTAHPPRKRPGLPAGSERWVREAAGTGPVAVSAAADLVALVGREGIGLYTPQGKLLRQEAFPLGGVYDLALAADGKLLVGGCEQGFFAWDLAGSDRWVVRAGNVTSVALSPTGRLLACGGRQLELWSLASRRLLTSYPAPVAGCRVGFSSDGQVLLALARGTPVAGWPVRDTPERRVLDGHTSGVPGLAFSPDGRQLVSVSKDRSVRVWDPAGGRLVRTLSGHAGDIEAVAFSPDGSLLATGDFLGRLRVWDAQSGELRTQVSRDERAGQVWRLQFGPGGEYLAAGGGHVTVWTVQAAPGRTTLERFCTVTLSPVSQGVTDLAARPGGPELVYQIRSGQLYRYDLAHADDAAPLLIKGRPGLRTLNFTPNGERLTFMTPEGTLGLYDWQAHKAVDTHRRAESVALSADGRWAALGDAERQVTVIELASGREVFTLPPEASDLWCLTWAPDGTKLALGLADGAVVVWDLEQVRARLAEFGFDSSSTARAPGTGGLAPVPAFDEVMRVNRLRVEAERARNRASEARKAGNPAGERDLLKTAISRDEQLAAMLPDVAGHRKRLAGTHGRLARVLSQLGDTAGALRHLEIEEELLARLLEDEPGQPEYRRLRASRLTGRGQVLDRAGRLNEAVDDARRAVTEREKLAADPGQTLDREQLSVAYHNLGLQLVHAGQPAEAERSYRMALDVGDRLTAADPAAADTTAFRDGRGKSLLNLGILRARAGDRDEAAKLFREAVALQTRLADDFPDDPDALSILGRTLDWLSGVVGDQGQLDEAARLVREAIRRQSAALERRPRDPAIRELRCSHQGNLAKIYLRQAQPRAAAAAARELVRLAPEDPAVLLRVARLLACCVPLAERNPNWLWGADPALAQTCRDEAIALARSAVAKGLTDAGRRLAAQAFDPVRDCPEFRRLVEEVKCP
jgi:serine/threonine protein kinase/WD40 repeat protein/tetratricopeptide (TPR) repeat protein